MRKRRGNTHHFIPISRFKVKKDPRLHQAYHDLFKNRTGWEAIELLKQWVGHGGFIRPSFLARRSPQFRSAFKLLFGNQVTLAALARIIKRDWIPPGVRMLFDYGEMQKALRHRKNLIGILPSEDDPY